jgi:hypothetical protein
VGIHRLLHSSCCFLNANTAITRQLIRTARMLEAEWRHVCGEAWVRGQRKISQVLGAFGLLDFTMLRPVLAWRAIWNLWTVYFFDYPNFFSGCGKPRIRGSACAYVSSNTVPLLQCTILWTKKNFIMMITTVSTKVLQKQNAATTTVG